MNTVLRIFLSVALTVSLTTVQADDEPLSARELFGKSLVKNMKIAPDGKHVALTYEEGSEVRLAVMDLSDERIVGGFEFGDNMHVLNFWWGSDTRVVMSVGEVTGNLDNLGRATMLFAANIDGTRRQQIFGQNLSGFQVLDPLPDDDRNILIARYHAADGGEPKGNLLDMYDGDLDFLGDQPVDPDMAGLVADNDGELRGAVAVKRGDALDDVEIRLYVKIGDEWESIDLESERQRPSVNFLGFSADNEQVYFASNHDMPSGDRMGVFRFDLSSRQIELLYRHDIVDARSLLRTPRGTVMGAWASFGPADYSLFDDQVEALPDDARMLAGLLNAFPDDDVFVTSSTRNGDRAIVFVTGDRNPGDFYLFDTENMQLQFLSASFPNLDKGKLVDMEPVRIEARDGLMLNAFLTRPADRKENLPLILNVHGGPFGPFDAWGFNPEPQFFAQHGYAMLQVNFRGSGNRGSDFQRAGWREWGGKMQDDLTDSVQWAIDQGIADPDRICIYGGSYGGYATLMGLIKTPDLYQCGVGYVGVYDLPWFWSGDGSDNDSAQGRDARRFRAQYMEAAVGENAESLRPVSPVHNVDRIKADLYIVHGGSDVRVPIGHAERLRDALDAIGKDYEWMVKDEEGHGFYDVDNRVELYTSMLAFFDKHIGENAEEATASVDAP
jgi:dipeptidyl aminopeptidase/acylaminoacyl peptidase